MNKIGKAITSVLAIIGGLSGPWGAYTAYDTSKFKQPFDEHSEISKSYLAQIASAEKRNDIKEVTRLRLFYEWYEEKWRATRQIAEIVAPIENLAVVQLTTEQSANLKQLLAKASEGSGQPSLSPKTLGAAYLAIKDFDNAAAQLSVVTLKNGDPKALALKAAAFSGLAMRTSDPNVKLKYEVTAVESYTAAMKEIPKSSELSGFAFANPNLKAVLDNKGVELTNH